MVFRTEMLFRNETDFNVYFEALISMSIHPEIVLSFHEMSFVGLVSNLFVP